MRRHWRLSRRAIQSLLAGGRVLVDSVVCRQAGWRLREGQRLQMTQTKVRRQSEPGQDRRPQSRRRPTSLVTAQGIVVRYADRDIVVVDKPAGWTTVRHAAEAAAFGARARAHLPPTLVDVLTNLLQPRPHGRIRAVHRLDKETSGLVVLALTPAAERHLGGQFRRHSVERRYLAVVRGRARQERIESWLIRDRGDGRRGSAADASAADASAPQGSAPAGGGQRAVTHVKVVEELGDFSLVECRLETGRTHQVRIHLGERGTPLCGERVYDRPLHGAPLTDGSGFVRPALHAAFLEIAHPGTGRRMRWTAPLPRDMRQLVNRLRGRKAGE